MKKITEKISSKLEYIIPITVVPLTLFFIYGYGINNNYNILEQECFPLKNHLKTSSGCRPVTFANINSFMFWLMMVIFFLYGNYFMMVVSKEKKPPIIMNIIILIFLVLFLFFSIQLKA